MKVKTIINRLYILISTTDRSTTAQPFSNLGESVEEMERQFLEAVGEEKLEDVDMSAHNADFDVLHMTAYCESANHQDCDWQVLTIQLDKNVTAEIE